MRQREKKKGNVNLVADFREKGKEICAEKGKGKDGFSFVRQDPRRGLGSFRKY